MNPRHCVEITQYAACTLCWILQPPPEPDYSHFIASVSPSNCGQAGCAVLVLDSVTGDHVPEQISESWHSCDELLPAGARARARAWPPRCQQCPQCRRCPAPLASPAPARQRPAPPRPPPWLRTTPPRWGTPQPVMPPKMILLPDIQSAYSSLKWKNMWVHTNPHVVCVTKCIFRYLPSPWLFWWAELCCVF